MFEGFVLFFLIAIVLLLTRIWYILEYRKEKKMNSHKDVRGRRRKAYMARIGGG